MIAFYPSTPVNAAFDIGVPLVRHTSAADREAFDDLYSRIQAIEKETNRAIRDGKNDNGRGYKKIRAICQGIE